MRSSDQRYRHVQRYKRDPHEWEQWSKALVLALRDVRLGEGDFQAVEAAIRGGAQEFNHLLLATGRTATDFARNYRRGSPNWHTIRANDLCPQAALKGERLDGFVVMRLSREQAKNVKLRSAKLNSGDILLHDPQGTFWTRVVGCWLDGSRNEHVGVLCDLRDRGESPTAAMHEAGNPFYRAAKERQRLVRAKAYLESDPEWFDDEQRMARHAFRMAWFALFEPWRFSMAPGKRRKLLEERLVVAEAYGGQGNTRVAFYDPDTSGRHCSGTTLRKRIDRVAEAFGVADRPQVRAEEQDANEVA